MSVLNVCLKQIHGREDSVILLEVNTMYNITPICRLARLDTINSLSVTFSMEINVTLLFFLAFFGITISES